MTPVIFRDLGQEEYAPVWQRMIAFTDQRDADSVDEIWFVEHAPVYTLGLNGREEHVLRHNDIALVKTDRGGQVTYHGPGQLVCYVLFDLQRRHWGVRRLVSALEQTIVDYLGERGITAMARPDAPGVYVDGAKIAALGLRVRRGCSYHGLSFNINMDLGPFNDINPCGYRDLASTRLADLVADADLAEVRDNLKRLLCRHLECEERLS